MNRNPNTILKISTHFHSILTKTPKFPPKASPFPLSAAPRSSPRPFRPPFRPVPTTCSTICPTRLRGFAAGNGAPDYGKEVDEINLKFAEAREEIEAALESKETVYFDEEAECARDAVKVVLELYDGLLARLGEKERSAVQRSMGLKIEQLKAELKQLEE